MHPEEFVLTAHTHGFLCYESMSIVKLYILSVSVFHVLCDYFYVSLHLVALPAV